MSNPVELYCPRGGVEGIAARKAVSYSPRREVMLMGNGRGAKALRFVVCFVVILAIMIYISPKVS